MAQIPTPQITDEQKRAILFVPCNSKARLHKWIQIFLGLDIPDCIVTEESTCTPMGMIWETYERALKNDDPTFSSVLYYSARDAFKTLGAAILEVLSIVHLRRSCAHMAAIEAQSKKAQQYVKKFFRRPFLRDYVIGDNERETILVRYEHKETGKNLTLGQFENLDAVEQLQYEEISNYIRILICTLTGTNSEHVPFLVVDELDIVPDPRAYEESRMIPAPLDGKMPITLLTSTRKVSFGLVQKEIENANESGLKIRHWNIIDCTQACPPARHLPERKKLPIYRSDETLKAISEEDYAGLTQDQKDRAKYVKDEGYAGCLENCKLFAMCKGRLATEQKSKSSLLKPIEHVQGLFRKVSLNTAKAQLLCWKPSTEGLIYPGFDPEIHLITPAQMAEMITGEEYPETLTKPQLLFIMKQRDMRWTAGMDFGFSHNFAVVAGPVDGNRKFVVEVISIAELEPAQQIQVTRDRIGHWDAEIYPDPENPQLIKVFKKAGFRMTGWKKGKGTVMGGIDIVRMKLRPAIGEPQVFLLKGDEGCELLAKRLAQYHWKLNEDGTFSKFPDEKDDDEPDAFRYDIMNVFAAKGGVLAPDEASGKKKGGIQVGEIQGYSTANWMGRIIEENSGGVPNDADSVGRGKSGRFKFDLG